MWSASVSMEAGTQGTVEGLRESEEGKGRVLRFRLKDDAGRSVPVEMRGQELRGVLSDGDVILFNPGPPGEQGDNTLRPVGSGT
jgi:hypothetical protein